MGKSLWHEREKATGFGEDNEGRRVRKADRNPEEDDDRLFDTRPSRKQLAIERSRERGDEAED